MLAKPDPATFQVLPWRSEAPGTARMFCDILHAGRHAVVRRPAPRAQAHAGQGGRPRLHLLHAPRDRVLPVPGPARAGPAAGAGRHGRLLRPHAARRRPRLPPRGDHDARVDGHLGGVQPPRGRAGPAGDRPAVRRRAVDRRQHHDVPARHEGGRARARASTRRSCPSRSPSTRAPGMHTHLSLFEGDRNAFFEAGAQYQLSKVGRSFIAGLLRHAARDHRGHQPVGQLLQAAARRRRGAGVRLLGAQQPLGAGAGADVQAAEGPVDPGRGALARLGVQPLPRVRGAARRRPQGHRGGLRAAARAPRTTSGR